MHAENFVKTRPPPFDRPESECVVNRLVLTPVESPCLSRGSSSVSKINDTCTTDAFQPRGQSQLRAAYNIVVISLLKSFICVVRSPFFSLCML